jgi:Double zinc ribbon
MNSFNHDTSDENWYAVLSLSAAAPEAEIAAAVELLGRRAAALAVTSPERSRELREIVRSIKQDLLSGPDARQRYDRALAQQAATMVATPPPGPQPVSPPVPQAWPQQAQQPGPQPWQQPVPQPGPPQSWQQPVPSPVQQPGAGPARPPVRGSGLSRFLRSGWVCSSCGTNAMPSDRFCMKCGARITAPVSARPRSGDQANAAVVRCAACGEVVAPEHGFCTGCGAIRP